MIIQSRDKIAKMFFIAINEYEQELTITLFFSKNRESLLLFCFRT